MNGGNAKFFASFMSYMDNVSYSIYEFVPRVFEYNIYILPTQICENIFFMSLDRRTFLYSTSSPNLLPNIIVGEVVRKVYRSKNKRNFVSATAGWSVFLVFKQNGGDNRTNLDQTPKCADSFLQKKTYQIVLPSLTGREIGLQGFFPGKN